MATESLAILGGAFDPIHLGHLTIAQTALQQFELDKVLFVPSYLPDNSHKKIGTPFEHRCAMVKLAMKDMEKCELSEIESSLEPPTYTVKMLEAIKHCHPDAELTMLVGADSLEQMDTWHQPEKIFKLAKVAAAARIGFRQQSHFPFIRLEMPEIQISATELRESIRAGRSVRFLVPDAVIDYIEANHLYRED